MRRLPFSALILPLLATALALPCFAAGDPGLLPPDGFLERWKRTGPPKVFEGTALYNHIDGGGEPFLEIGFEACTVQRYASAGAQTVLEVYRMSDETAALGVFLAAGGPIDLARPGESQSTRTENQASLRRGRYYVVATCFEARPGLSSDLAAMTAYVGERVEPGTPPSVLSLLPRGVPVPGTLRLFRGPVGLQAVATLGEGDLLLQAGKVAGAAADYAAEGGTTTAIVLAYASPAEASAALAHLRAHLDSLLKPVKWEEGHLVFQDSQGKFGRAAAEGAVLRVTLGLAKP